MSKLFTDSRDVVGGFYATGDASLDSKLLEIAKDEAARKKLNIYISFTQKTFDDFMKAKHREYKEIINHIHHKYTKESEEKEAEVVRILVKDSAEFVLKKERENQEKDHVYLRSILRAMGFALPADVSTLPQPSNRSPQSVNRNDPPAPPCTCGMVYAPSAYQPSPIGTIYIPPSIHDHQTPVADAHK